MHSSRSTPSTISVSNRPSLFKSKSRRKSSRTVTASECPPNTTPPPTTSPISPSKKSSNKHGADLKTLSSMVQSLAVKLKKREKEVQKLKEKSDKFDELSLSLESTEERLVNAVADNQALNRRVRCLQSTINMQDVEENHRWNRRDEARSAEPDKTNTAATTTASTKSATEECKKVEQERDMALLRAGEMAITLARSRAETDELRDQLEAITKMMQAQKSAADGSSACASSASVVSTSKSAPAAPASPTSVMPDLFPVRSLQGSLQDLSNLWSSSSSLFSR